MSTLSWPPFLLEPVVRAALAEDWGRAGDITSAAVLDPARTAKGSLVARQKGVIAGLELARLAFTLMDPQIRFAPRHEDGTAVAAGEVLATLDGNARALLGAERVALNFLGHLSGIASETRRLVEAVRPYPTHICCTRKTTPGLRVLEKDAVRAGGGSNHRFGLDDAVLIKDNHVAIAGGVRPAVQKARAAVGHLVKIELEVDTLDQLREALDLPIDAVLLDNMEPARLTEAVRLVGGRFVTEASGGITLSSVAAVAASGVDYISVGWLTHSAPNLDVALDCFVD